MKRVLVVVGLTVLLVALVFGLCLACDAILMSASAMTVDMPDSGYVRNNLLYDNDAYNWHQFDGTYNSGGDQVIKSYDNGAFYVYSTATNDFTIEGNHLISNANSSVLQRIFYSIDDCTPNVVYTFSAKVRIDTSSDARLRIRDVSPNTNVYSQYTSTDIVLTLSVTPTGSRCFFMVQWHGSIYLDWWKVEQGDSFSGYVDRNYSFYGYTDGYLAGRSDGFDLGRELGYSEGSAAGYNLGFVDGADAYAYNTQDLNFNNVESQSLNVGWSDFYGISSLDEIGSAAFSLSSYFYNSRNIQVLSSGFAWTTLNNSNDYTGFFVWISSQSGVTTSDILSFSVSSYFLVQVNEHTSSIYYADPDLPLPWNPYDQPDARRVILSMQRGYYEFLEEVGDSAYNNGFSAGRDAGDAIGYNRGKDEGYAEGLQVANSGNVVSLVTALVDTPIKYFMSLLDFDILGFNMFSVLKFAFTFCLFFFIIRLMVKGKVS